MACHSAMMCNVKCIILADSQDQQLGSPGPGGFIGGAMWGSATDGERMYVAINTRAVT